MFLYHCVSEPCTGSRYSLSSSNTNHTGMEIVRPEFLPVTLILISRYRERRSFRASFRAGMRTSRGNFTNDDGTAVLRKALVIPTDADQFTHAKLENIEVNKAV